MKEISFQPWKFSLKGKVIKSTDTVGVEYGKRVTFGGAG